MRNIIALAITTFRESVRSKILYTVFFFTLAIVLVSALFGSVTVGDQILVVKNLGLASISLFAVAYAVISGASLVFKELSKKTIYNILAKPVPRWHFLVGKYLGMVAVTWLMTLLMGGALSVFLIYFEGRLDLLIWVSLLFTLAELLIICAAAIFFSSIVVTPLLSGLFTFGIFIAGRSTDYITYFIEEHELKGLAANVLYGLYYGLPHLDDIRRINTLVYGVMVPSSQVFFSLVYSFCYAGVLLVCASFIFKKREFN